MFAEIVGAHYVLKAWKQNPTATKRQIGVWQHWKVDDEENERPLSESEVQDLKKFLRRNAPTGYFEIFPEEAF